MTAVLAYFESSIILSALLEDTNYEQAREVWNLPNEKITSVLTPIEVITVLRRYYSKKRPGETRHLRTLEKKAAEFFNEISVLNLDDDIRKVIELKREFSHCRSLDAIHVASGYYLAQSDPNRGIGFFSFDKRVNEVALKVGIKPHFV